MILAGDAVFSQEIFQFSNYVRLRAIPCNCVELTTLCYRTATSLPAATSHLTLLVLSELARESLAITGNYSLDGGDVLTGSGLVGRWSLDRLRFIATFGFRQGLQLDRPMLRVRLT